MSNALPSAPVETVLSRLQSYKSASDGWYGDCPAHNSDSKTSLHITQAPDGKCILYCFGGCKTEDIVQKLRLTMEDLFPPKPSPYRQQSRIVAAYDYTDDAGQLLYQAIRKEPKDFVQRKPDGQGWIYKLNGVVRVLYRLPEVRKAVNTGQTIYIAEGEKDVDNLRALGLVATCNVGGAGKWQSTYSEALQGADVVILPDNDDPGARHGAHVARSLHGIARRVRKINLPGLPDHGDVSDWLAQGHTADELARLVADAPDWSPVAVDNVHSTSQPSADTPTRRYLTEDEIDTLRPPTWLIKGTIPAGEVTLISGPGDAGKTFIVTDMMKRVAQYYPVMYGALEDAPGIRVRKRAWEIHHNKPKNGNFLMWTQPLDLYDTASVDSFIAEVLPLGLRMITFDTLSRCLGGADENSNTDMAIVMSNCERIAHATGAAVVLLHHTTKDGVAYRGASALKNNTYGHLEVSRDDDLIQFKIGRIKNTKDAPARYFKLVTVPTPDILDEDGKPHEPAVIMPAERVISGNRLTQNQIKMLESLQLMTDAQGGAKTSELQQSMQLNGDSFYRPLKALRGLGLVDKGERHTDPLTITADGRERLARESTNPEYTNRHADSQTPAFEVNTRLESFSSSSSNSPEGSPEVTTTPEAEYEALESNATKYYYPATGPTSSNVPVTTTTPLSLEAGSSSSNSGAPPEWERDQRIMAKVDALLTAGDIAGAKTESNEIKGIRDWELTRDKIEAAEDIAKRSTSPHTPVITS